MGLDNAGIQLAFTFVGCVKHAPLTNAVGTASRHNTVRNIACVPHEGTQPRR